MHPSRAPPLTWESFAPATLRRACPVAPTFGRGVGFTLAYIGSLDGESDRDSAHLHCAEVVAVPSAEASASTNVAALASSRAHLKPCARDGPPHSSKVTQRVTLNGQARFPFTSW